MSLQPRLFSFVFCFASTIMRKFNEYLWNSHRLGLGLLRVKHIFTWEMLKHFRPDTFLKIWTNNKTSDLSWSASYYRSRKRFTARGCCKVLRGGRKVWWYVGDLTVVPRLEDFEVVGIGKHPLGSLFHNVVIFRKNFTEWNFLLTKGMPIEWGRLFPVQVSKWKVRIGGTNDSISSEHLLRK